MPPVTWQAAQRSRTIGNTSALYVYFDVIGLCASTTIPSAAIEAAVRAETITPSERRLPAILLHQRVHSVIEHPQRLFDLLAISQIPVPVEQPRGDDDLFDRRGNPRLLRCLETGADRLELQRRIFGGERRD